MVFTYEENCSFIDSTYVLYNDYSKGFLTEHDPYLLVDPDIAGIGVVTNFIATAYITWTLFFLNYVFAYEPPNPTGRFANGVDSQESHSTWRPNPIDIHTVAWIRRVMRIKMSHPRVARIFDECILSMCDLQIMTGFALLSCAFILGSSSVEPLSSFHWFLIVCLAWFSAVTHLAGLSILRSYFDGRPRLRAARIVLMFTLLVVLVIALIPTGFFNWQSTISAAAPESPAVCFLNLPTALRLWNDAKENRKAQPSRHNWQEVTQTAAMQQMVLAVILLVMGFVSRCIKLFRPLTRTVRRGIRIPAHDCFTFMVEKLVVLLLRRPSKIVSLASIAGHDSLWDRFWILSVFIPLFGLFLTGRVLADLISSMLAEIVWVLIALIWGTFKFTYVATSAPNVYYNDHRWSFGQMMAVALLASPIVSLIWKFGELAMQDDNKDTAQSQETLNAYVELSIYEISEDQPLSTTQHIDQHGTTAQPHLFDRNAVTDSVSMVMTRDYYSTAPWIWPAVIQSYLPPIAIAFLTLFLASLSAGLTMIEFWLTTVPILPYLLLGFPAACAATMTAGLVLDKWYRQKSGWKWNFMFWMGIFTQGTYCMTFFDSVSKFFRPLPAPYVVVPCSLYIVYVFCGGLVIFGKGMKSCLLTGRTVH